MDNILKLAEPDFQPQPFLPACQRTVINIFTLACKSYCLQLQVGSNTVDSSRNMNLFQNLLNFLKGEWRILQVRSVV